MNKLQRFRVVLRAPKESLRRWLKCLTVQYHNPGLILTFPVALQYDDINAIKIGSKVLIGAFAEIVVQAKSPYSKIPGQLIIEEGTVIGSHANIRATGGRIFIGRNSSIAQQVSLIASNHTISNEQPYRDSPWDESKTGVFIDENVWIGAGVTILPGCVIGKNSIIGAGSVVARSIPENEIWVGVPARKLRDIGSSENWRDNELVLREHELS
jgi:acetyltransferase-like isoleucine patch superfamily enzyme